MGTIWTNHAKSQYAGIRVYRNAAHSLTNSLAQLPFDATSNLLAPEGLSLSNGDIVCDVAGELGLGVFVTSAATALSTGHVIEIRKNPSGTNTLLARVVRPGNANEERTDHADAVCDVAVGDVIRVNVAAIGTSADITVGNGYTWAYATITPR